MEVSSPLPFIPSVDLGNGPADSKIGLTRNQLSYLGCVYLAANDDNLEILFSFLQRHITIGTYVDVSAVTSTEDIIIILDSGARTVFVKPSQLESLSKYEDRVLPIIPQPQTSIEYLKGGLLNFVDEAYTKSLLQELKERKSSPIFLASTAECNTEKLVEIAREFSAIPIIPATRLSVEKATEDQISVPRLIADSWTSDRADNLVPTVVTDESGIALGLVYSSQESLAESLKTGTGVYQSRKRGLWYKGATSGDTQELIRISLDCDQDCLKFVVKQQGRGFCHLPQSTCFGELRGISKLEKTLLSRKSSAPEGSYTARLFSDEKLLRAKIMEEAEELCDAKTSSDVAFEAADLIYFTMTKAVSVGVTLADIERSLDAKSVKVKRRQGDAKGQWAAKEGISNESTTPKSLGARKR